MSNENAPAPCVTYSNVFLNPLLEEAGNGTSNRRERDMLRGQAEKLCGECPLLATCLRDAVTKFDVSGFVAGTTRRQRREIRAKLGITVGEDDLDDYTGVTSRRQFDAEQIQRIRASNPSESLSSIANRVGCSVSTVKRHLRRPAEPAAAPRKEYSTEEVMAAASSVLRRPRQRRAA